MVQVRFISGNYKEICHKGLPTVLPDFATDTKNVISALFLDFPRQASLPSNGKTFDDVVAAWLSPHASKAYSQGDITSALFPRHLHGAYLKGYLKGKSVVCPFREKMGNKYKENGDDKWMQYISTHKDVSFAFYDDYGVPCAFSISYSLDDEDKPNLWVVSVTRNTTAQTEDREVIIFGSEEIISSPNDPLVSLTNAEKKLSSFINSKEIANHLKGIFLNNGEVDLSKLTKFTANKPQGNDFVGLRIGTTDKIDALKLQKESIDKWDLNTSQFNIVKEKIKEKQSENITKAFDWYNVEIKKDHNEDIKNIANELKQFEEKLTELKEYKENLNNSNDYQLKLKEYAEQSKKIEEHIQKLNKLKEYKENLKGSNEYKSKLETYTDKFAQLKNHKENLKGSSEYKSKLKEYESTLTTYKNRLTDNQSKLNNIHLLQIDVNKISKSLIKSNQQTFLSRNAVPSVFGSIGVLGAISLTLIASGVFAPLGLALTGVTLIAALVGIAVSVIVTLTSAAVVWRKESQLSDYREELNFGERKKTKELEQEKKSLMRENIADLNLNLYQLSLKNPELATQSLEKELERILMIKKKKELGLEHLPLRLIDSPFPPSLEKAVEGILLESKKKELGLNNDLDKEPQHVPLGITPEQMFMQTKQIELNLDVDLNSLSNKNPTIEIMLMSKLQKINPHIKYENLEKFKPITPEKFPKIILIASFERRLKEINSNINLFHILENSEEITLEGILKQADKLDVENNNESYLRALLGAGLTMEEFKELEQHIDELKEVTKSLNEESSFVIREIPENEHKDKVGTGLSNEFQEEIKEFHDTLEDDSRFLCNVLKQGEQEVKEGSNLKVILPTVNMPQVRKDESGVKREELTEAGNQATNKN